MGSSNLDREMLNYFMSNSLNNTQMNVEIIRGVDDDGDEELILKQERCDPEKFFEMFELTVSIINHVAKKSNYDRLVCETIISFQQMLIGLLTSADIESLLELHQIMRIISIRAYRRKNPELFDDDGNYINDSEKESSSSSSDDNITNILGTYTAHVPLGKKEELERQILGNLAERLGVSRGGTNSNADSDDDSDDSDNNDDNNEPEPPKKRGRPKGKGKGKSAGAKAKGGTTKARGSSKAKGGSVKTKGKTKENSKDNKTKNNKKKSDSSNSRSKSTSRSKEDSSEDDSDSSLEFTFKSDMNKKKK